MDLVRGIRQDGSGQIGRRGGGHGRGQGISRPRDGGRGEPLQRNGVAGGVPGGIRGHQRDQDGITGKGHGYGVDMGASWHSRPIDGHRLEGVVGDRPGRRERRNARQQDRVVGASTACHGRCGEVGGAHNVHRVVGGVARGVRRFQYVRYWSPMATAPSIRPNPSGSRQHLPVVGHRPHAHVVRDVPGKRDCRDVPSHRVPFGDRNCPTDHGRGVVSTLGRHLDGQALRS
jgi:hypothetical protein